MANSPEKPQSDLTITSEAELPSRSRRNFLELSATGAASVVLGACSSSDSTDGVGNNLTAGSASNTATGAGGGGAGAQNGGMTSNGAGGMMNQQLPGTNTGGQMTNLPSTGGQMNGGGGQQNNMPPNGGGAGAGTGGMDGTGQQMGGGGMDNSQMNAAGDTSMGEGGMGGQTQEAGGGAGGTSDSGPMVTIEGGKENNFTPLPDLPAGTMGPSNPMLPDPFKFMDGSRITSKADWERLRADLSAMLQAAVYGPKMPPPDKLEASMNGGSVTVNMTVGSNTKSFSFMISGGGSADNPKPCVIKCGGSGVPFPNSVASVTLNTDTFALQNKQWPTSGLMHDLYGDAAAKSGSDIAWAWGASRIIDALEQLPEAGIDTTKMATTGCSYAGKGALAMGIFDERVALTVMQEGGSGGSALWRVSTAEAAAGQNIQEATEIVGEQNWEGKDFHDLFSGKNKASAPVDMLIADQHFAVAIAAPRAILLIENDIDWLGPVATYGGGVSGRKVFEALGIEDRCGVSVAANHGHCQFPGSQQAALTAFINRFLLGMNDDTSGVDDFNATNSTLKTFNEADFIDWDVPTLSGDLPWDPFA